MSSRLGVCDVCERAESRYTCPRCETKSCSLACVKKHKVDRDCDGKRTRTAFIDIRDFEDADVVRDYRFLEEVGAEGDRAKRWRPTFGEDGESGVGGVGAGEPTSAASGRRADGGGKGRGGRGQGGGARNHARRALDALKAKCAERGVEVRFMANGMARRRTNTTYHYRKRDELHWRLEWIFHVGDARIARIDEKVPETALLRDVYAAHVKEMTLAIDDKTNMHPFKLPVDAENLNDESIGFVLVAEKFDTPANAKLWHAISLQSTVADALRGKTVLEFPTFHAAPKSRSAEYVLVQSDTAPVDTETH